jgi:electron transfer flavoprotein alpha subunit
MKILVIAEHNNQQLKFATHHTLSAAKELKGEIHLLIIGYNCKTLTEQVKSLPYITQVIYADHEVYEHQLAENSALLIAEIGKNYDYILTGATTYGKNILPRVAALLDVAPIGDVIKIISADTFERPIYAGNAIATVQSNESIKLLTIRTTAFPIAKENNNHDLAIASASQVFKNEYTEFESQSLTLSSRPELTSARVVISGGRGLKSAENFHLLDAIADCLGGAVGASRAAVDAGFAPNDYQVGQTGKIVAPDLYIAVGISGAIQHIAGMKDSKIIVAINNDPDAPIFQVADYGLVGDLFKILPELKEEIDKVLV